MAWASSKTMTPGRRGVRPHRLRPRARPRSGRGATACPAGRASGASHRWRTGCPAHGGCRPPGAPCQGKTSASRPPTAHQSRRASSSSLSDCESQSARLRPRSHWSRTMAATCLPFAAARAVAQHPAAPEADRIGQRLVDVGGLAVVFGDRSVVIAVVISFGVHAPHGLPAAPMRYSAARWRSCAWPARTTLSSWASDSRPSVTTFCGSIGR